jgi:hypothetical protein
MVQMMLVRLNSRGGLYSVLRLASHSARVWPKAWWSRELAIVYVCVLWWEGLAEDAPHLAGSRWILKTHGHGDAGGVRGDLDELLLCECV